MKIIYTAGPFRPVKNLNDMHEIHENIEMAKSAALQIWKSGHVAICPHANTGLEFQGAAPDDVWLKGDLLILERCDAVLLLPSWEKSFGAKLEKEHAEKMKIPVFTSLHSVILWADGNGW